MTSIKIWFKFHPMNSLKYETIEDVIKYYYGTELFTVKTSMSTYVFNLRHLVRIQINEDDPYHKQHFVTEEPVPVGLTLFNRSKTRLKTVYRFYQDVVTDPIEVKYHIAFKVRTTKGFRIDYYNRQYLLSYITAYEHSLHKAIV